MNRALFVLSIFSVFYSSVIAQQYSPVYSAQAGAVSAYPQNQNGFNNPRNNGYNQPQLENQYGSSNNNQGYSQYQNSQPGFVNGSQDDFNSESGYNSQNVFLENYVRKGAQFKATVYKKDKNGQLYKTKLSKEDLNKTIVIFFGDWCPHCSTFLTGFARNINSLVASGVKIIFVSVPSIERLQKWQIPNDTDYTEAEQKLSSFGIQTDQSVNLVLLGDKTTLDDNIIDSLPTMLAVKDGKEYFRGGSDNSIDKVDLSNQNSMNQFLEIWESNKPEKNSTNKEKPSIKTEEESAPSNVMKKNKKRSIKNKSVNNKQTNFFTSMLNKGCDCRCYGFRPIQHIYSTDSYTYKKTKWHNNCIARYSREMCPSRAKQWKQSIERKAKNWPVYHCCH